MAGFLGRDVNMYTLKLNAGATEHKIQSNYLTTESTYLFTDAMQLINAYAPKGILLQLVNSVVSDEAD